MADVSVSLGEWTAYRRRLDRFCSTEQREIVKIAVTEAMVTFDDIVRTELPPPVRKQAAAPWWTAKQKRWWWGTMRRKALGKSKDLPGWKAVYKRVAGRRTLVISGHYRRTGTLVKTLTYEVRQSGDITDGVYGTNSPYAKVVLDKDDQATYHKGNWKTLQELASDATPPVRKAFETAITRETTRRLVD